MVLKRSRFGGGFVLNGTSPQLQFTEEIEIINLNALRFTQLRNSLESLNNKISSSPAGRKGDLKKASEPAICSKAGD